MKDSYEVIFAEVLANLRECDMELIEEGLKPHFEKEFWERVENWK